MFSNWIALIGAIGGAGGIVTLVSLFVAPAAQRIALKRQSDNRTTFYVAGVVALSGHCDNLIVRLLIHEPDAKHKSSKEVLADVRISLDSLTADEPGVTPPSAP